MKWNRIRSQKDIETLMEKFGSFRESVLTEVNYQSGAFIHPGLLMYPVNAKRELHMVFQRQDKECPAIEIVFGDMEHLSLVPVGTNCFAQITDVTFLYEKGKIYWARSVDFDPKKIDTEIAYMQRTWVVAKKAQWRVLEGHLGNQPIFHATK